MTYNKRSSDLLWFDRAGNRLSGIDASILSMNVSYSMDMCPQITVTVHDPNFNLASNNYFSITRDVIYKSHAIIDFGNLEVQTSGDKAIKRLSQVFEIASTEIQPGPAVSPVWTLELRTKAIQQMKRDRNPGAIKGSHADYVRQVAETYGLLYYMQNTSKNRQITKATKENRAESTWDTIKRLAGDAKFVLFETNGYLVFCSQLFLLGKWGLQTGNFEYINPKTNTVEKKDFNYIPIKWPRDPQATIQPIATPSLRTSENDPLEATGTVVVDRLNGTSLRPGMTVHIEGIPGFEKFYLIENVTYNHFGTDPVQISIRTPEREDKNILDYVVGGTLKVGSPSVDTLSPLG